MSLKRTVFGLREVGDVEVACSKSSASASELGWLRVSAVEEEVWP